MKIYHVGVYVKVSCGISYKNLTARLENLQFTFTMLFGDYWLIILNMVKKRNFENSPFY